MVEYQYGQYFGHEGIDYCVVADFTTALPMEDSDEVQFREEDGDIVRVTKHWFPLPPSPLLTLPTKKGSVAKMYATTSYAAGNTVVDPKGNHWLIGGSTVFIPGDAGLGLYYSWVKEHCRLMAFGDYAISKAKEARNHLGFPTSNVKWWKYEIDPTIKPIKLPIKPYKITTKEQYKMAQFDPEKFLTKVQKVPVSEGSYTKEQAALIAVVSAVVESVHKATGIPALPEGMGGEGLVTEDGFEFSCGPVTITIKPKSSAPTVGDAVDFMCVCLTVASKVIEKMGEKDYKHGEFETETFTVTVHNTLAKWNKTISGSGAVTTKADLVSTMIKAVPDMPEETKKMLQDWLKAEEADGLVAAHQEEVEKQIEKAKAIQAQMVKAMAAPSEMLDEEVETTKTEEAQVLQPQEEWEVLTDELLAIQKALDAAEVTAMEDRKKELKEQLQLIAGQLGHPDKVYTFKTDKGSVEFSVCKTETVVADPQGVMNSIIALAGVEAFLQFVHFSPTELKKVMSENELAPFLEVKQTDKRACKKIIPK